MPLIRRDGRYFGTLCALDPEPSHLTDKHFAIFRLLATLISYELEAEEEHDKLEGDLDQARTLAQARERLVAILSHDLRTPLTAVSLGAQHLAQMSDLKTEDQEIAVAILGSARRASRMVEDLLDFTRAGLGGGIPIQRAATDLRAVAEKVAAEVRSAAGARQIVISARGDCRGDWDGDRAAQVVANLLNNAVEHGGSESPVQVRLHEYADTVILEVENRAAPIPPSEVSELFSPFRRASSQRFSPGLGLGLYIVQQIMHAHSGTVEVSQQGEVITFRTVWPRVKL